MRLINYIFRAPFFTLFLVIIGITVYAATIILMFCSNWDEEFKSLKVIHKTLVHNWKRMVIGDNQ